MFCLTKPTEDFIRRFIESQRHLPFGYAEVGATKNLPPAGSLSGYAVDRNRILLGAGERVFNAAVFALRGWKMFDIGWVRLCRPDSSLEAAPVEVGMTVAVLARHFGFWSLHPARVVYLVDEEEDEVRRAGFAYGTLPAHGERGEERFSIEWHRRDDSVWYDLLAFSRPNALATQIGSRLARGLQQRFARDSLRAMARAVAGHSPD